MESFYTLKNYCRSLNTWRNLIHTGKNPLNGRMTQVEGCKCRPFIWSSLFSKEAKFIEVAPTLGSQVLSISKNEDSVTFLVSLLQFLITFIIKPSFSNFLNQNSTCCNCVLYLALCSCLLQRGVGLCCLCTLLSSCRDHRIPQKFFSFLRLSSSSSHCLASTPPCVSAW